MSMYGPYRKVVAVAAPTAHGQDVTLECGHTYSGNATMDHSSMVGQITPCTACKAAADIDRRAASAPMVDPVAQAAADRWDGSPHVGVSGRQREAYRPCYLGPQGWQHEPGCPEYVARGSLGSGTFRGMIR